MIFLLCFVYLHFKLFEAHSFKTKPGYLLPNQILFSLFSALVGVASVPQQNKNAEEAGKESKQWYRTKRKLQ